MGAADKIVNKAYRPFLYKSTWKSHVSFTWSEQISYFGSNV